jgi:hypothetical protein
MTDTLRALIAEMESAPEGSRELDAGTHMAVTDHSGLKALCDQLGAVPTDLEQFSVPHYTTSLDAALPGEEIVRVERTAALKRWRAETNTGRIGWASTEPLARRAAALRAMLHEMEA